MVCTVLRSSDITYATLKGVFSYDGWWVQNSLCSSIPRSVRRLRTVADVSISTFSEKVQTDRMYFGQNTYKKKAPAAAEVQNK